MSCQFYMGIQVLAQLIQYLVSFSGANQTLETRGTPFLGSLKVIILFSDLTLKTFHKLILGYFTGSLNYLYGFSGNI